MFATTLLALMTACGEAEQDDERSKAIEKARSPVLEGQAKFGPGADETAAR